MSTPTHIGRYEILEEIGRGAMGVVYLAHDPKIDRRVAIKTIHKIESLAAVEAEEMRERFTREARAAGKLQHQGIVTIFDVGEHGNSYFIAMEYIEGTTLETHTSPGGLLSTDHVLDLVAQACDALDYAHQQHVVHRDIKPANMMLVKDGRLKITDFGLAKNPTSNLTQEGVLMGTPNYMAPEQILGKPLDGRANLFSLGAVLYEMLTGQKPFSGDSITTIIYRIVNEPAREPRDLKVGIPPALSRVVLKALEKEPERRFQTGEEFGRALRARAAKVLVAGVGGRDAIASAWVGNRGLPQPHAAPTVPRPVAVGVQTQPITARVRARSLRAPGVWYTRVRAAAIVIGTLAAIFFIPAAATRDDRWGRGTQEGGEPVQPATAMVGVPGLPAKEDQEPLRAATASPAAEPAIAEEAAMIDVPVETAPAGGRIYLDDVEILDGLIRVPAKDVESHTVVAENDCFIDKVVYRPGSIKPSERITIPLVTPKKLSLPIRSTPAGARILLDGADTGRSTPADVPVSACGTQKVILRRDGYKDETAEVTGSSSGLDLKLAKIADAWVAIASPYTVEVFEGGRRLGTSDAPIKIRAGAHDFTLRNEDFFVERKVSVSAEAEKKVTHRASLPALGSLTVLASPSNCRIFINDREVGVPPINDHRLAEGTYRIRAIYVPTGEAKETTVSIVAGSPARVPFKFTQ